MPLTLPKNVRGQRRGATKSLAHSASSTTLGAPVPIMERYSRKGLDISLYVPHPSLILGLGLAPKFPSTLQPSSVLVTCTHTRETLEFTLSSPNSGTPGFSVLGVPFALPGSFQMPELGKSGQVLPRIWKCILFSPNCFYSPAWEERSWDGSGSFFRTV